MRVRIISHTLPQEVQTLIQRELSEASARGEVLKKILYSTAPAILADETKAIGDTPDERAACWHNVLLIFEDIKVEKSD